MKLYTHWTESKKTGELKRTFFGARSAQETASRAAKAAGLKVLGTGEYNLEPTATAVANFINDRAPVTSQDLVEEYLEATACTDIGRVDEELPSLDEMLQGVLGTPPMEDMLS